MMDFKGTYHKAIGYDMSEESLLGDCNAVYNSIRHIINSQAYIGKTYKIVNK